jgi:Ca2+/H+ antiporter
MIIDTVLVGVTAEFLVSSINGLVASNPSLSAEWVGLILLPIVSADAAGGGAGASLASKAWFAGVKNIFIG